MRTSGGIRFDMRSVPRSASDGGTPCRVDSPRTCNSRGGDLYKHTIRRREDMLMKLRVFSGLLIAALAAWWMLSAKIVAQPSTSATAQRPTKSLRDAKPGALVSVPQI